MFQRVQCLKKKFYFHFQDYIDLIMWKVGLVIWNFCSIWALTSFVDCGNPCILFFFFLFQIIKYPFLDSLAFIACHPCIFCMHISRNSLLVYDYSEQVQFLDRHHLLIKFGSVDGGVWIVSFSHLWRSDVFVQNRTFSPRCILDSP